MDLDKKESKGSFPFDSFQYQEEKELNGCRASDEKLWE